VTNYNGCVDRFKIKLNAQEGIFNKISFYFGTKTNIGGALYRQIFGFVHTILKVSSYATAAHILAIIISCFDFF
jgi:hypothetical protein